MPHLFDGESGAQVLSDLWAQAGRVVFLTGAGVSTESGVPDFRSPGSPWRVHKPIAFPDFLAEPALRAEAWRRKFATDDSSRGARPGRSHRAVAALAASKRLDAVITQNIDGLHQAGGLAPETLIELHGNGTFARCLSCGIPFALGPIRTHLEATGEAPVCSCGGFVKSATIAFGQSLHPAVIAAATRAARTCDLMIAVGSSLVVRPAATLPLLARSHGAVLVIVNRTETPLDSEAHAVIRGEAGDVLEALAIAAESHSPSFA